MPKINTLKESWEAFQKLVIPKNASDHQRREMRNAFYAGAASAHEIMAFQIAELSDDEALERMNALFQEIMDFASLIKKETSENRSVRYRYQKPN